MSKQYRRRRDDTEPKGLEGRKTVKLTCGHTIKLRFTPNPGMKFPCSAQQNCGYQLHWTEVTDHLFPEVVYNKRGK